MLYLYQIRQGGDGDVIFNVFNRGNHILYHPANFCDKNSKSCNENRRWYRVETTKSSMPALWRTKITWRDKS